MNNDGTPPNSADALAAEAHHHIYKMNIRNNIAEVMALTGHRLERAYSLPKATQKKVSNLLARVANHQDIAIEAMMNNNYDLAGRFADSAGYGMQLLMDTLYPVPKAKAAPQ